MGQLEARQRSLLRQQYVLGMTVDAIGSVYQVRNVSLSLLASRRVASDVW